MNLNDTVVMTTLQMVVVPFLILSFCFTASGFMANKRDNKLNQQAPDTLTYKWGYFLGYYGILFALAVVGSGLVLMAKGFYQDWFLVVLIYLISYAVASYGVLNRRKWGWLLQIPLTLNPGLWAVNSVYFSNRWRELS